MKLDATFYLCLFVVFIGLSGKNFYVINEWEILFLFVKCTHVKLRNIVDYMVIFFVKLSKYYPFTIIDFSI